jgi:formylglycine-generating enzyme required for sulfatase activity
MVRGLRRPRRRALPDHPPGPAAGATRVFRGGSWNTSGESLELYYRNRYTPDSRSYDIGFRCARSAP